MKSKSSSKDNEKKRKSEGSNDKTPSSPLDKKIKTKTAESLSTIQISRKGVRYELETPSSFLNFKNEVFKLNIIKSSKINFVDLTNTQITDEASYQKFLGSNNNNNNVIIVYSDNENPMETPEELMVDITPSKSILLKAGTSDYTTSNALAEFIDNSIQAVRNNSAGEKTVKITIKKPVNDMTSITFWDNGCGMNKDDLQRWATMGMSQADLYNRDDVGHDKTATGLISRFGVGAKKAAFYLGSEILVTTKLKVNNWVNQATMSLEILRSTGDQEWKIPIRVRDASSSEKSKQFTEVTINNVPVSRLLLTPQTSFEDSILSIKRDLAHIYYYYIHQDPTEHNHYHFDDEENEDEEEEEVINTESQQSSQTTQSQKAKSKSTTKSTTTTPVKKGEYNIILNDLDLVYIQDSMESLYIKNGKKTKSFELNVDTTNGESTTVKCHLRYFPYIQENETLPIPYRVFLEHPADEIPNLPMTLRKPGFEVFWNGRLIPDAHIDRLGFMVTGVKFGDERIEDKYAQRVKGALFLTSAFPVNQNKTHIIKEHPIFLNLEKSGSRANGTDWKKWILRCHKMDQDFQFETEVYDSTNNRTYCKSVSFGGLTYQREDHVILIGRPTTYGTIKQMYFTGVPELRTSTFFFSIDRMSYKQIPTETYPISRIKTKITPGEFEKHWDQQKAKLPSRLKIIEADKSPLPKNQYQTGETIQWITVALLDNSKPPKEVERRITDAESIKIDLTITLGSDNEPFYTSSSSSYYETGKSSFRLNTIPFNKAGAYTFKFTCSYPNVKPAIHYIKVVHGSPINIKGEYELTNDKTMIPIESNLPSIFISSFDEHTNQIPFEEKMKTLPRGFSITGDISGQSEVTLSSLRDLDVEIVDDGRLKISGLRVIKAKLGEDNFEANLVLKIKFNGMTCSMEPIRLISGPPTTLSFIDSDPFQEKVMNLTSLEPFTLVLKDKCGNLYLNDTSLGRAVASSQSSQKRRTKASKQVVSPKEYILVSSKVIEEDITVVSDENGNFNFQDSTALFIKEKTTLDFEENGAPQNKKTTSKVPVQFTFYKDKSEIFSMEKTVIITPSSKPAYLKLFPLSDTSMVRVEEDQFRALSGSSLMFGIKVYGAGGGGRGPYELPNIKASISTSWDPSSHNKEATMNSSNMFELPVLITDKTTRSMMHWVSISTIWDVGQKKSDRKIELKKELSIQTTGGAPTTFFSQFGKGFQPTKIRCDSEVLVDLKLHDKRGNVVTPSESRSGIPIEPYFVLVPNSDIAAQSNAAIKICHIDPFNTEKNLYPCRISMIGFGEFTLVVKDRSNQVAEYPLKLNMIEGSASQVRVNGLSKYTHECARGDYVEEIKVTICDTLGNVTSTNGIEIQCEWVNLQGAPPPLQIKSKNTVRAGIGSIKNMDITGSEGTYELRVSAKNMNFEEATIFFVVKGSATIHLYNNAPIASPPNAVIAPIKISILDSDQQAMVVQKSNVRMMVHMKVYECTSVEEDGSVYVFEDVKSPRKSGEYPIRFIYSTSVSNKIEMESTLVILPDKPIKLFSNTLISPQTSSLLANNFTIYAVDCFDNKVPVVGDVTASIELSKQPASQTSYLTMPVLIQNTPVPFDEETCEAVFPTLALKESVGVSQAYRIRFTSSHMEPLTYAVEFVYRNSKEDIDKKIELESKRVSLNKEIKEMNAALESTKVKLNNYSAKKDQLKAQIEEAKTNLVKFDSTFDKSKATPEEVRRTIQSILQEIDEKNSLPRRGASLPLNPISKEMSELSRSSGEEKSGIIGLVMELFCLESNAEAQLVGKLIGKKMEGVVVTNKEFLDHYYHKYKNVRNPVYFLSIDLLNPFNERSGDSRGNKLPLQLLPNTPQNGFIDFLVNRVQMKEKHEKLRKTLGWTLFKDTIVFQSLKDGWSYRDACIKQKRYCPPIVCVNEIELIEASGMVMVGKKDIQRDQYSLGQLPFSESAEFANLNYQRNLWETYKKVNHESYSFIKANQEGIQEDFKVKSTLEAKLEELNNELQQVCEEIKTVENQIYSK